ncbi:MAG: hypothetical protein ABMA13_01860 [Chthoniobacteraceae bacterium]
MNFTAQVALDALRCAVLAGAAFAIGWPLGGGRRSTLRTVCLIAPLLMPSLLISYAAAPVTLMFGGSMLAAFYSVLLMLKLAPLAALARDCFPSPLSAEAAFCARLLPAEGAAARAWFAVRAAGPVPWATLAVLFLLTFTDFELASLFAVKTWTVMLFDAHAGGLDPSLSLRRIALPVTIQLAVIVALLVPRWSATSGRVGAARGGGLHFIIAIAVLIAGLPLARVAWLAATGFAQLRVQEVFAADLVVSLGIAAAAAPGVWLLMRGRALVALPGLLGALVLALLVLAFIQVPVVRLLRDTPLPLIAVEMLLIAPIAFVLRELIRAHTPREALHLARMAGSRRLIWDLALAPRAGALALLFMLAYFELTAATILAPIGLTPVFARLHNLAHYGQSAVLSAMLIAATLVPAALLALTVGAARLYARRDD